MFKESFKYYKSKNPPPDLKYVYNFHNLETIPKDKVNKLEVNYGCSFFGLKPSKEWNAYELKDNTGLIYIQNPFTSLGERYWIMRSIKDYTCKPNKLNIDAHNLVPSKENWWDYTKQDPHIIKKLRWATLGYHHDWDTKVYNEDVKTEFPLDLHKLCSHIGTVLGFDNFNAEAAIVNFYYLDSTLSGHTDHSEQNLEAPLFSFSFGNSAIFLIGGKHLEHKATPLFLHSGDIIIMSKESRICYHGVPKVVKSETKSYNEDVQLEEVKSEFIDQKLVEDCLNSDYWLDFDKYLEYSRLNMNVRQVLKRGQKRLNC